MINDPAILTGIVLNGTHGIYDIHTPSGIVRCTLRGKLKKAFAAAKTSHTSRRPGPNKQTTTHHGRTGPENSEPLNRLSVGDYVRIKKLDDSNGVIEEILPRQTELTRKDSGSTERRVIPQTLLANLDQVVIVLATAQPEPHFGFLDRYLAICASAEISPLICLNKIDLPHDARVEKEAALYEQLGYPVLWTSSQTGKGIDQLRTHLKDHTTLFTGPSGVGKSSLVNALEPDKAVRTSMVSDATGKGRHTTTGSQLYPLSDGGWLADSAGIRALAAWNISSEDLASCFVEFRPYLGECAYSDCTHINEEECAILQAVSDNLINERRHRSYVRMHTGEER